MLTDYVSPDQRFVACPNQDVVYGAGFLDNLDKEPIVFQVPDFGDRFWVYALYDARTDEFSEIGKQYGTKPGFYMMVGPNWKGETPNGHYGGGAILHVAGRSPLRAFSWTTRRRITRPSSRCSVRSSSTRCREFDGKMKTKDWSKLPHFPAPKSSGKGETKWVNPETFFDELPAVMKQRAAAAGRGSPLQLDRQCAGGGRQGPDDQADARRKPPSRPSAR